MKEGILCWKKLIFQKRCPRRNAGHGWNSWNHNCLIKFRWWFCLKVSVLREKGRWSISWFSQWTREALRCLRFRNRRKRRRCGLISGVSGRSSLKMDEFTFLTGAGIQRLLKPGRKSRKAGKNRKMPIMIFWILSRNWLRTACSSLNFFCTFQKRNRKNVFRHWRKIKRPIGG